jgi:hypothetical protein
MTYPTPAQESGHPESCPWCGRDRIHGVCPSPSGDRHYRCVSCGTTFFIHEFPQAPAERLQRPLKAAPVKPGRPWIARFAHKH